MLRITLAGLRAHPLRLALTALAIALAVGFVAGTLTLTDMMRAGAYQKFAGGAQEIDVAVLPAEPGGRIPADGMRRVGAVPGVRAVFGDLRGPAPLLGPGGGSGRQGDGKDGGGKAVGDVATLGVAVDPGNPAFPYDFVNGRGPRGAGEAVLTEPTARRAQARIGDTVRVVGSDERVHSFRLVGIVDFGIDGEIAARGAVGLLPETLAGLATEPTYRGLAVASDAGVSAVELRRRVAAELGPGYQVLTGAQLADRRVAEFVGDVQAFTTGLLLFGVVALLVAALVIYNIFQILAARRVREVALLRCVGAGRRQVFANVLAESAAVGVVGSLAGLAMGVGLAAGTYAAFGSYLFGSGAPAVGAAPGPFTVVAALGLGVTVTVAAGMLPAWRAARVAPVSALRAQAEPGGGASRSGAAARAARVLAVVVFGGAGVTLTVLGLALGPGQAAMPTVAAGGAVLFLGVIALLPLLVGPLVRAIGWLPGRLFGVAGSLAARNARRNPHRTATTTLALTVGVGLVTLFTVVMSTSRASVTDQLDEQFPVDFMVRAVGGTDGDVPRELAAELRGRPEVGQLVEVRETQADLAGERRLVSTVTHSAIGGAIDPEIETGSLAAFESGTVLVARPEARALGIRTGDTVPLETRNGTVRVRVAATFATSAPTIPLILLPEEDFERHYGVADDAAIYADAAEGVAPGDARRAVEAAAQPYPLVRVTSTAELEDQITSSFDAVLGIVSALLGLSIVIAVLGIANTLSLSALERAREAALLRALGLTRRQLGRMLRTEAAIISALGGLLGVGLGLVYGWCGARTMTSSDSFVFSAPPMQLVAYVVLAGLVGALAAALPARGAARTSVVAALADE